MNAWARQLCKGWRIQGFASALRSTHPVAGPSALGSSMFALNPALRQQHGCSRANVGRTPNYLRLAWRTANQRHIDRNVQLQPCSRSRRAMAAAATAAGTAAQAAAGGGASQPALTAWAPAAATHLRELLIKDFALVAEQKIQLQPGLTVITGGC